MRRVNPDDGALRIPARIWLPRAGEDMDAWLNRSRSWWRSHGFASGRTVLEPDGGVFFAPSPGDQNALYAVAKHHAKVKGGG